MKFAADAGSRNRIAGLELLGRHRTIEAAAGVALGLYD
jgi:hypothetical protein